MTESPRINDKDIDEILTKVRSPTQTATARSITKKGQCGMLAKDCAEICVCARVGAWGSETGQPGSRLMF